MGVSKLTTFQQKQVAAAQGYLELGMVSDALAELRQLPEAVVNEPLVLELQVLILIRAKRWKAAKTAASKLCAVSPEDGSGYMHLAFCQHELGDTKGARKTLLGGPRSLEKMATYYYNLACYEAVLGQVEAARVYLEQSIRIDKRFRDFAKYDVDLAALHGEMV